jgi:hypothetical protein
MNPRSLIRLAIAALAFLLYVNALPAAQTGEQEEAPLRRVSSPPVSGTFHFVQRQDVPPFPFDPFFGQLPVYEWKPGVYIVDDSQVDYPAWNEQKRAAANHSMESSGEMSTMSSPSPCSTCPTNGEGSASPLPPLPPAYSHSPTNLWLEIVNVTNNQAFFVIHTPDPGSTYHLFSTTNLATHLAGLNRTNWTWLARTISGQTNITLTNL